MNLLRYSRLSLYSILMLLILLPLIACPEDINIRTIIIWFMFVIYSIISYKILIKLERKWNLLEDINRKKQANNEEKKG